MPTALPTETFNLAVLAFDEVVTAQARSKKSYALPVFWEETLVQSRSVALRIRPQAGALLATQSATFRWYGINE